VSELRQAQDRVRAYLEIHKANPYQVDDIHGTCGMNGKALLRASDVRTLLRATEWKETGQ
jgi:hypothetical protein